MPPKPGRKYPFGEPIWHKEKRTRCMTCNGQGKYYASYPRRLIDPCKRCNGTGRET